MSDELTNSPADRAEAPAFLNEATFIALDGKTPVKKGWTTDPAARFGADEAYSRVAAGGNVGVALGPDDLVLDVDPRNFDKGDDPFERLKAQIGDDLSGFPAVRTGSGGWHVYMRLPEGTGRIKRDLAKDGFPGIDLKFVGGQVVAPGSVHPDTGKPYVVERDLDPLDEGLGLPVAPAALMELVKRPKRSVRTVAPGAKSPEWLALALEKLPVEDYRDHGRWLELMMACHDATGGAACDEFVQWSAGDLAYEGHEQSNARRWDSLDSSKDGRVTFATLRKHLVDAGVNLEVGPDYEEAAADFADYDEPPPAGTITRKEAKVQARLHRQTKLPQTVEEVNRQGYIATKDDGGFRVYRQVWDYELDRTYWEVQKKQDFLDNLAGYSVPGETPQGRETTVPVASSWLRWPGRNRATAVKFDPANRIPASAKVLNLWTGWTVKPAPGDWSLMKRLLLEGLCDGNQELYDYVLDWSAFMVQHPDKPAEVAVFFVGEKGTGKGTYCRALCELAGRHGMHVNNPDHFGGHFNAHMRDCIFLFADEALWAGDKKAEGQIKALITEPTVVIEGKGKDAVVCRNYLHVMGASNNPWVWQATEDERRLVTNRVSSKFKGDHAFFTALRKQMDEGGKAAMLHELLERDISDFHPRKSQPRTEELKRQIDLSRPRVIQILEAAREEGLEPFEPGRDLIAMHEDILATREVQKSIDRIGHTQVKRHVEEWLREIGAQPHDRCTKKGGGLHGRPTERLWSLRDHERYAGMTAIQRADEFLTQKHDLAGEKD
ncbi:DUF5906 domain-containing protein [Citromicrobium bathyomarinum]|uniref:DUF5906 domain-containing protein n=1 Tax=Citromicrobium bathyomarinum TaxID=72174 RepID=UPI001E451C34|nr:bifunctional DNA primase/polymerase [Citromicrobium bathyomarinum]